MLWSVFDWWPRDGTLFAEKKNKENRNVQPTVSVGVHKN